MTSIVVIGMCCDGTVYSMAGNLVDCCVFCNDAGMDRLRSYEVFATIVACGGFNRAAAELAISPANVSRHIQQLEQALGTRLLERTSRRMELTDSGRELYTRVRLILDEVADLEGDLTADGRAARGRLRINAPLTFGLAWLTPLITAFAENHPAIELDIHYSDRVIEMADESFDVALRISRAGAESLVSRRVATTQMRVCAAPTLLAGEGEIAHVEDLRGLPRAGYLFSDSANVWTLEAADGTRHAIDTPCTRMCANGLGLKATVLRGEAIALLPEFFVQRELLSGQIVEVLPTLRADAMDVRIIYAHRRHLARRARLFIDFLVESFHRVPWA